jgi:hypothetical protein
MKNRRKTFAEWTNRWGDRVEYAAHPGAMLARHMQWIKPTDGFATMSGPEPDSVNVAVLAPYTVTLGLEHEYYARVEGKPLWVSFGHSSDPESTLKAVKTPIVATWQSKTARAPRPHREHLMPDWILANRMPENERWRYNDIGDY